MTDPDKSATMPGVEGTATAMSGSVEPSVADPTTTDSGPPEKNSSESLHPGIETKTDVAPRDPIESDRTNGSIPVDSLTDSDSSRITEGAVLELLGRLAPRDQLDELMLRLGMGPDHKPPSTLELSHRTTKFVEWAAAAGKLEHLALLLQNKLSSQAQLPEARAPHPRAPKASIGDAVTEIGSDAPFLNVPCFESLSPLVSGSTQLQPTQMMEWAEALHTQRLLLISCVDLGTLNAVARTLPFHNRFSEADKLKIVRSASPTVWQTIQARTGGPAVVLAYATEEFGESWMRTMPRDEFTLTELQDSLKRTFTWLLVVTKPEIVKRTFSEPRAPWIIDGIDFIGPRLRGGLGPGNDALETEFRRQYALGYWGHDDRRTLQMLADAVQNGSLKEQIDALACGGMATLPNPQLPPWKELLESANLRDRCLYEIILFVAAFFFQEELSGQETLSVTRFDSLVRSLIPLAAEDALPRDGINSGSTVVEQLVHDWLIRGEHLRTSCGLRTALSDSHGVVITLISSAWREELVALLTSPPCYWIFNRMASYIRRPEFLFRSAEVSRGVKRVAATQSLLSTPNNLIAMLDWMILCRADHEIRARVAEDLPLSNSLKAFSDSDIVFCSSWTADVLRLCPTPDPASVLLGSMLSDGNPKLVAAIINRLWSAAAFGDVCIVLARRLLSEAGQEIKDEVLNQMRDALRRGDISLSSIWRHGWLSPEAQTPGPPGRAAAILFVDCVFRQLGGLRSSHFLRNTLTPANADTLLTSWLWHPELNSVIHERALGVAALPGLWVLPENYRRLGDGTWAPSDIVLTVWWSAFMNAFDDDDAVEDLLPFVFRAMAVAEWSLFYCDTPSCAALLSSMKRTLPSAILRRLRIYLQGLDAGIAETIDILTADSSVTRHERRTLEARLKTLRDSIRRSRRQLTPSTVTSIKSE